jgi:hypothetical protein
MKMIEVKAFKTFITIYSLLKSERLSANFKPNFHKALIISVMTYAYPACELAADTYLLKSQRLQNKVLRIIGKFPMYTPVRELHTTFIFLYVYDYITKSCRQQAEVKHITRMNMFAVQDKAKPDIENIRGLNLAAVKLTTAQVTKLPL